MKKLILLVFLIALCSQLSAAVVILNGLTHIHPTTKGSRISGKIVVKNEGAKEARILIYKQDLISKCGQSIEYTKIKEHHRSLGDWLQTNIDEKILAAKEEYTIQYTIDVPTKDVEKGTFWSVLMVEGADPIKEEKENGMKLNSKVRYAVQILADVDAFESPKLVFEDVTFNKKDTLDKSIKIKLKNEGIYSTRAKISLEVYSDKGVKVKTFEATQKRIYPEWCSNFEITLKDLPKGKYEGVIVADNEKDMFGSNITLEIE
jgi:hypothetical protein